MNLQFFTSTGISISDFEYQQFHSLVSIFQDRNSELNLSAIRNEEDIWIKHIIDSLMITKFLNFSDIKKIIDVGIGGGFPAFPLAIHFPEKKIFGCDSVQKKIRAVQDMVARLNLKNMETVSARAEVLGREKKYRESYDLGVARALASLPVLLEWLSPFVKINGYIVAYKNGDYKEELCLAKKAIELLGLLLINVYNYELPKVFKKRSLLVFKKIRVLSSEFPRGVGVAKRKPLVKILDFKF